MPSFQQRHAERMARDAAPDPRARRRTNGYRAAGLMLFLVAALVYLRFDTTRITLTAAPDIYPPETREIYTVWRNGTLRTISFGLPFTLERLEGSEWQAYPPREPVLFQLPLYSLNFFGTRPVTYGLDAYAPLPAGRYRLVSEYILPDETRHPLYAEFEIAADAA